MGKGLVSIWQGMVERHKSAVKEAKIGRAGWWASSPARGQALATESDAMVGGHDRDVDALVGGHDRDVDALPLLLY